MELLLLSRQVERPHALKASATLAFQAGPVAKFDLDSKPNVSG